MAAGAASIAAPVAAALSAGTATAGDFDGSKELIGTPDEMGAPAFIRVDFDKKEVIGPRRASPVLHVEKTPERVLLLGTKLGLGWTRAIHGARGRMHVTLAGNDGAFVLIHSCTPL